MNFSDVLRRYSDHDCRVGTDKLTTHSYGALYDEALDRLAGQAGVRVLEIGVYSGAFLKAVCDFLPHAAAVGVDIDTSNLRFSDPRMTVHLLDGTRPDAPKRVGGHFDLIVDDGSHVPDHQVRTLDLFAPLLKPGGTYIIEDIATDAVLRQLQPLAQKHGLTMQTLDLRHVKGRFDDLVAVFGKPNE